MVTMTSQRNETQRDYLLNHSERAVVIVRASSHLAKGETSKQPMDYDHTHSTMKGNFTYTQHTPTYDVKGHNYTCMWSFTEEKVVKGI